jgi:hypothetical protein
MAVETSLAVLRIVSGLPVREDEPADAGGIGLLAGAALGFAVEAGKTAVAVADVARRTVVPPASFVAGTFFDAPRKAGQERAASLNEAWRTERPEAQALAQAVATELIRRISNAVLDQLDLTQIVLDRVDLDRVVASVDLDQAIEHVNLDEVIDRVDVERVLTRLDLSKIAMDVVEQIDLPEIIRASTGSVASESVRVVRVQAIGADRAITRVVDRLLGRSQEERLAPPPSQPGSEEAP